MFTQRIHGRVEIEARSGANLAYAWRFAHGPYIGADVVIIMLGGNDLSNGASTTSLVSEAGRLAEAFLQTHAVQRVIFPSIWPRASAQFNRRANLYFRSLSTTLESRNRAISCWRWDLRQPWETVDGVHLTPRGYRKAVVYLCAIIVWAARRLP